MPESSNISPTASTLKTSKPTLGYKISLWIFQKTGIAIMSPKLFSAEILKSRRLGLIEGRKIGIVEVLRYNQRTLSPDKFKESARKFDFETLDAKYPPMPEVPHEQKQPSTESIFERPKENEPT